MNADIAVARRELLALREQLQDVRLQGKLLSASTPKSAATPIRAFGRKSVAMSPPSKFSSYRGTDRSSTNLVSPRRKLDLEAGVGGTAHNSNNNEEIRAKVVAQIRKNYYDEKRRHEQELTEIKAEMDSRVLEEVSKGEINKLEALSEVEHEAAEQILSEVFQVRQNVEGKFYADFDVRIREVKVEEEQKTMHLVEVMRKEFSEKMKQMKLKLTRKLADAEDRIEVFRSNSRQAMAKEVSRAKQHEADAEERIEALRASNREALAAEVLRSTVALEKAQRRYEDLNDSKRREVAEITSKVTETTERRLRGEIDSLNAKYILELQQKDSAHAWALQNLKTEHMETQTALKLEHNKKVDQYKASNKLQQQHLEAEKRKVIEELKASSELAESTSRLNHDRQMDTLLAKLSNEQHKHNREKAEAVEEIVTKTAAAAAAAKLDASTKLDSLKTEHCIELQKKEEEFSRCLQAAEKERAHSEAAIRSHYNEQITELHRELRNAHQERDEAIARSLREDERREVAHGKVLDELETERASLEGTLRSQMNKETAEVHERMRLTHKEMDKMKASFQEETHKREMKYAEAHKQLEDEKSRVEQNIRLQLNEEAAKTREEVRCLLTQISDLKEKLVTERHNLDLEHSQAQENLRMAHAKEISNVRSRATEDVMAAKHQLRQLRKDLDTLKRTSQAELHAKELSHLKEIDEREIKASMHAQEQFDRQIEKLKALEAEHARSEVSIREKLREENKSLRAQIREKSRIHQDEMNKHVAKHNLELAKVKEKLNESQELLEEEIHSKTTLETELKHKIDSMLKDTDHDKRILKNKCSKLEHDQISLLEEGELLRRKCKELEVEVVRLINARDQINKPGPREQADYAKGKRSLQKNSKAKIANDPVSKYSSTAGWDWGHRDLLRVNSASRESVTGAHTKFKKLAEYNVDEQKQPKRHQIVSHLHRVDWPNEQLEKNIGIAHREVDRDLMIHRRVAHDAAAEALQSHLNQVNPNGVQKHTQFSKHGLDEGMEDRKIPLSYHGNETSTHVERNIGITHRQANRDMLIHRHVAHDAAAKALHHHLKHTPLAKNSYIGDENDKEDRVRASIYNGEESSSCFPENFQKFSNLTPGIITIRDGQNGTIASNCESDNDKNDEEERRRRAAHDRVRASLHTHASQYNGEEIDPCVTEDRNDTTALNCESDNDKNDEEERRRRAAHDHVRASLHTHASQYNGEEIDPCVTEDRNDTTTLNCKSDNDDERARVALRTETSIARAVPADRGAILGQMNHPSRRLHHVETAVKKIAQGVEALTDGGTILDQIKHPRRLHHVETAAKQRAPANETPAENRPSLQSVEITAKKVSPGVEAQTDSEAVLDQMKHPPRLHQLQTVVKKITHGVEALTDSGAILDQIKHPPCSHHAEETPTLPRTDRKGSSSTELNSLPSSANQPPSFISVAVPRRESKKEEHERIMKSMRRRKSKYKLESSFSPKSQSPQTKEKKVKVEEHITDEQNELENKTYEAREKILRKMWSETVGGNMKAFPDLIAFFKSIGRKDSVSDIHEMLMTLKPEMVDNSSSSDEDEEHRVSYDEMSKHFNPVPRGRQRWTSLKGNFALKSILALKKGKKGGILAVLQARKEEDRKAKD